MIRINTHFRKMNILRKSMIFTLLISLLLSSFPAYAVTLADNSSNSALASSKLSNAVVVSEDTSKRGEFEKHYLLSDGSFMAVSYPEAVHYLSEGGTWEEVDNRLSLDRATSRIVNGDGDFSVSFADSPSGNSMASLLHNGKAFTWGLTATKLQNGELTQLNTFSTDKANIVSDDVASLVSARSGSLSTSSTSAIGKKVSDVDAFASDKLTGKLGYDELFEAVPELSVEYSVYHNKIEEDIFINAPTDLRAFSMNIQADGLTARLNDDGSVDFLDENGDMQYRIGIPYMEDANNEVLNDIEVTVDQSGNTCTVTYTPNEAWLTSEDRVYPILLDPSITTKEYNSNIVDTYVYEGNGANHSTEQKLYYGVKSGKIYRTYIKINNLPNIDANMPVIGATMELSFVSGTTTGKTAQVYKVSGSWNAGTITYANQPPIYSSNYLDSCLYNSSVAYMTFDLSTDVTTLYDEFLAANNYGYVIKYEDESNSNPDYNVFHSMESTTTAKRPVVTITYGYALPSSLSNGSEYSFQNYGSFSYMTVHNGTDANDVNVYQQSVSATSNLGTRHKFKLEYVPSTGGYYLRSMISSGGTNRVLDIYKINGYVSNGSNVQIYSPNDPLAQHWFIIGTGITTFKIVPRTDMSLALTAYPGGDGSSSGTTTTSTGNIFVSTYDDTNDYQQWMIRDADGNLMSGSTQRVQNGTYYLNNRNYGKYLHKSSDTAVNAVSGLISTYENTIRWKITHVGNDQYTIQSSDDLTKYLYSGNSTNARLATMLNITDNCLWTIRTASGGGILVQNVATQAYLKQTGSSTIAATSSLGTSGTTAYDRCVWRLASIDLISNRELTSGFSINEMILSVGDTKSPTINKTPSNAIWATASDFTYSYSSGTNGIISVNVSNGYVTGQKSGIATYKATHKVTNRTYYFKIYVDRYTYELVHSFGFSDDVSVLIRDLYNRVDTAFSNESNNVRAWRCARILSEFYYDSTMALGINKWNDVAGSVTENGNRQQYFVDTLGYTSQEYSLLNNKLRDQHENATTNGVIDFCHLQYSLAARLAYSLDYDSSLSNWGTGFITGNVGYYTDAEISYFAGWLGDAVLTGESGNTTSFKNDDYMSDLDAENIYHIILQGFSSAQAFSNYYASLANGSNRSVLFKAHITYDTVRIKVFTELIDAQISYWISYYTEQNNLIMLQYYCELLDDEEYHWNTIKNQYHDTYNFLKSLNDSLSNMANY